MPNTKTDNPTLLRRLMVGGAKRESAERAIADGIKDEDIEWNARLGRPIEFLETQDPDEEAKRRQDYLDSHDI